MSKILITGGGGQIAYDLIKLLEKQNHVFMAPSRAELDITDPRAVDEMLAVFKPDAVINTAAYTKVDLAQQEASRAYAVNRDGAENIAKASARLKCPLIHLSTDYIFDGNQTTPYVETSPIVPLNVYGSSKRYGELAIEKHCQRFIILRVSGVFGVHGTNFVKTILRLAKEKETLQVVSDQTISPTPAKAIAETILLMLKKPRWGIYHYCGAKPTNWHAFTEVIIQKALEAKHPLLVKKIEAITTENYPTAAKRPYYSVLNCQRITETFGISQPDWEQELSHVITQLSTS